MYSVSRICERDVEDVMTFMKRTFFIDEPLYKGVGYCNSASDDTPDLDEFCRAALPGVSLMAKNEEGSIVATLICGISPIVNPTDFLSALKNCKCPKYKKVIQMMILREVIMEIWNIYPNEKQVFEIKMASTDAKWRNKGIMNQLMKEAENAAKELNIRVLRIETSSAYSAKSAERHGYKCVFSRAYTEFMLDGKPLILPEPPHTKDNVYVKELY
ncbi:dopamine N-acetyltransferase-like [Zerene cesonia]|uniref:dopamine N-acetyltransferase-like n=1 Tax=Zerene cesonia TaxID=33412 RepID=UPI0018E4EAAF|nr:dopamine N-acetyltransferase-like [Zerene cesonia]